MLPLEEENILDINDDSILDQTGNEDACLVDLVMGWDELVGVLRLDMSYPIGSDITETIDQECWERRR